MKAISLAIVLAGLATLVAAGAAGAAGERDRSFGGNGIVIRSGGAVWDQPAAVAIQGNGKIVVAGTAGEGQRSRALVARFRPNGRLDASFSGNGRKLIKFPGSWSTVADLAIQDDGRIVVAGDSGFSDRYGWDSWFDLARLRPNGRLDRSFARNGIQRTTFDHRFGNSDNAVLLKAITSHEGKVVAVGERYGSDYYTRDEEDTDFAVARYTRDGQPDPSFSGDGILVTDFRQVDESMYREPAEAVAVEDGGRIVVAGHASSWTAGSSGIALARYQPDGNLDPSFADDGLQLTGLGDQSPSVSDLALSADARITVAGRNTPGDFMLARYSSDGGLDPGFGDGGIVTTDFDGGEDRAQAVSIDAEGRSVVAGTAETNSRGDDLAVARYLPGGDLDMEFSGTGLRTVDPLAHRDEHGVDSAIDAFGRVILLGNTDQPGNPIPEEGDGTVLVRLLGDERVARCSGKVATIVGTHSDDRLVGSAKRDVIAGLGGDDVIRASGGNDLLCGGRGNDRMAGGRGNDQLHGNRGRDRLNGGPGRDRCHGGPGRDRVRRC